MAFTLVSNQTIIARNAGTLYGTAVGNTNMASYVSQAGANPDAFLNLVYTNSVGNASPAVVAANLLAGLGLPAVTVPATAGSASQIATDYIIAQLTPVAVTARGAVVNQILNLFSGLTADPVFGTFATTWNTQVTNAVTYASVSGNTDTPITTISVLPNTTGSTFTLTTGTDNPNATAFNDTFQGIASDTQAATDTFGVSDTINGGSGLDTLNILLTGTNAANNLAVATVSNVETINIRATQTTAATITTVNGNNFVGETAINSDRSSSAVTITNLATGASAGMIGNGSVTNGNLVFGYKTTSDAAVLNLSNGTTAGNVQITSAPTAVTINSTGAANIIGTLDVGAAATGLTINAATGLTSGAQTGAALKTITVAGAAATAATPATPAVNDITSAVQLGTLAATVTTIDASGMTAGGVSATLIAGITSFKGGAGNDTITTFNTTSQTASIINAGSGTDTLRVGALGDINTSTKANTYAGFEILDNNGVNSATAIDMSLFTNSTITAIRVGGGQSVFSNVTATQAANVTLYATVTTGLTIPILNATSAGQLDTLKLTVSDGLTAVNTITIAQLTIAGTETVNLTATDNVTFTSMTGMSAMNNFTSSGAGNLSLTTGALATVVNTIYDTSAETGTVTFTAAASTGANGLKFTGSSTKANTLTGTANGDTLIGGSANDTITNETTGITATAGDTLTGGAGNDTFVLYGSVLGSTVTSYSGASNITDFSIGSTATTTGVSGTDILSLSVTAANYSGTIVQAATGLAVGVAGATAIQSVATSSGAAAYVAGTDLIKLSGAVTNTAGATVQALFNNAIGSSTVTGMVTGDQIFVTFFDSTNSKMVILEATPTANSATTLETADLVQLIGTVNMNAADYAAFSNSNLAIVA